MRVIATTMQFNGVSRIRVGTIFDIPDGTKLPSGVVEYKPDEPTVLDLGKRDRGDAVPIVKQERIPPVPGRTRKHE